MNIYAVHERWAAGCENSHAAGIADVQTLSGDKCSGKEQLG